MKPNIENSQLVPYLSVTDAQHAIKFYGQVFGVEPFIQLDMPDGRVMHCEFRIGNGRFFVSEELPEHGGTPSPKKLGATTVALHLYVDSCDETVNQMELHGSEILMPPTDMFWGERFARIRDPFGHEWGIATITQEMSPFEIQKAANELFAEMERSNKTQS